MNIQTPPNIPKPKGRLQGNHWHTCPKCGKKWKHDDPCVIYEYYDCEDCR